ncbi:MAG: PKD domain-containing protein [Bacteroidales bacterium]|nr:PKD domain-containing protein [Bacteroidales bacterium]
MKKCLIISILCFLTSYAMSQTPSFTWAFNNGTPCIPATVNFTNTSTLPAQIDSVDWDFGDGSTHYVQTLTNGYMSIDPTHPYYNAGTYTITMVVHYTTGVTRTYSSSVTVVEPIKATFTQVGDTICPNGSISFNSHITAPGNTGAVASYVWNFGDGGSSTDPNPTYVFTNGGNTLISYEIRLTVTDTNGCVSVYSVPSSVTVWPKPIANFGTTDSVFCYEPGKDSVTVQFTDSTTGTTNNTYQWYFGGMSNPLGTSTSNAPSYTFPIGTYDITLVVTSPTGCKDTITKGGYIKMINFDIVYTVSDTILCGIPSTTTVQGMNPRGTSYKWTWGDGYEDITAFSARVKTYRMAGDFNVTVSAISPEGCLDTTNFHIHVYDLPPATAVIVDTNMCDPADPVYFYDSTDYLVSDDYGLGSITWNFGDSTSATGDSVSHVYGAFGDYDVQMLVTTPYGCILDTGFYRVHIFPMSARAMVIDPAPPNPPHGCAPHTVTLQNIVDSLVSSSPIVSYIWRWDYLGNPNDTTVGGETVSHTYTDTGHYHVYLTLINEQGCEYDVFVTNINVGKPPVCDFTFEYKEDCKAMIGLNVAAYDSVNITWNDSLNRWDTTLVAGAWANEWTWIDPSTGSPIGSGDTTSVGYSSVGYQSLQLVPANNGCSGSGPTKQNVCYVCPPVVAFDFPKNDMDGTPPEFCDFINICFQATHANCQGTRYVWGAGDGKYNQTWSDTLEPDSLNTFCFYYCDTGGAEPGYMCTLEGVFTATLWAENADSIDTASPTYNRCGYCTDQFNQQFFISPYRLNFTTNLGSENVYVCAGDSIKFWDSTEVLNCVSHENWGFKFIYAADQNPDHTAWPLNEWMCLNPYVKPVASKRPRVDGYWMNFYYPNTYVAVMQDTSVYGKCIFTDTLTFNVYPQSVPAFVSSRTKSNFYYGRDTLCMNNPDSLHLRDMSFTNPPFANLRITGWEWILDRDTSYDQNPILVDTIYGLHDLKFTVINEYGCDSTITAEDYVLVNLVDANFTTSSKIFCRNTIIPFTNQSAVYPTSYNKNVNMICTWDWGDGSDPETQILTSNATTAQRIMTHIYDSTSRRSVSDTFCITLTVEAEGLDCIGTFTDCIVINGPIAAFVDDGHAFPCPGSTGKNITFTDSSQGNITYYKWIFYDTLSGTSNIAEGPNMSQVMHNYISAGSYDLMHIVVDNAGCVDTLIKPAYVFIDGPTGDFSYTPLSGCINLTVSFQPINITNCDSTIINPDGATQVVRSGVAIHNVVRNTYKTPGVYVPYFYLVKWTNSNGQMQRCVVEWAGKDSIWAIEMNPDFETDSLYCPGVPISFPNTTTIIPSLLSLDSASWNYDANSGDTVTTYFDGATQYDSAGLYKVTMTGHTKLCSKSKSYYIEVMEIPDVKFIPDSAKACDGLEVTFTVDSTTISPLQMSRVVDYEWTFSDGETLTGHPASREFANSGTYTYDVDITYTPQNCTIHYVDTVTIFAYVSPTAAFTPNPTEANAGETFNFADNSTQGDGRITKWAWDYGDGNSDSTSGANVSHVYENTSGYITVTLVITDEYGCKSTAQEQVLVTESMAFPNVFTPDGECGGEKCLFRPIEDKGFFKELKMEIYNRWGELVYKTHCTDPDCPDVEFWWDGSNSQGNKVSDGVYYWVIYGIPLSETNTIILNGSVTVISKK